MSGLKTWLRQLFGKSQEQQVATETLVDAPPFDFGEPILDPLETDPLAAPRATQGASSAVYSGAFSTGWMTDPGLVRGHNEDALFVFTGNHEADNAVPPFGLFVLADGMGGHQAGEIASSLAVRISASHLMTNIYLPVLAGLDRGSEQPSLTEIVRESVSQANRRVSQDLPGSGSTLTCGLILGDRLFIGHVGDSRAYLLRLGEEPRQLTNDHSLVNRLMEMGQLTEEEAAVHPQRNVLYRAIGQGGSLEVDVSTHALKPGDQLLLCSDGLWGMLEESEMWNLVKKADSLQSACAHLVDAANAAGGNDNISVVLTEICKPEEDV